MMQNNDSNKFKRFFKEKGYYMLLLLCIAAVGVSGYFLVSSDTREPEADPAASLSVPIQPEQQPEAKVPDAAPDGDEPDKNQNTPAEPAQAPLELPVMPVSGSVLQDHAMDRLCYNPTTQDWRVHNGVDLSAELGQEVRAARSGKVTAVYEDDFLGSTVVIQHADGYTSHYCNLAAEPMVNAGDSVSGGQIIGLVGASALIEAAQEPHLHFEVYHNGEAVDPAGFLY